MPAHFARLLCLVAAAAILYAQPAFAHFGMLIPSSSTVSQGGGADFDITLSFSHPMEMEGMTLDRPAACYAVSDGKRTDLLPMLKPATVMGKSAWKAATPLQRPGLYQFAMEPTPYWEPAEDCYIIHYTKVIVPAFGMEDGWDQPVGLKTEIVPLTRPFGLYAGSLFQGKLLVDGKPVPGATVEIEYYNRDKKLEAPNEYMTTLSVVTDANGVFTAGLPFAGWWGFAGLTTAAEKKDYKGTPKDVELGAVLWVEAVGPVSAK